MTAKFITKCDNLLSQSATAILLQSATSVITKCDSFITKCDNWKFVPDHFFKKLKGLHFLLLCNYDAKDFENAPCFYKDILLLFHELKALYGCHHGRDTILFNNKGNRRKEEMVGERY